MPRSELVRRSRLVSAAVVSIAILIGCGTGVADQAGPVATPIAAETPTVLPSSVSPSSVAPSSDAASPPTGSPIAFTSTRYGYTVELPAGWYVRIEELGTWTPSSIGYVGPGTDAFEEDFPDRGTVPNFPGKTFGLYVSAFEPKTLPTIDAWTDQLASTMETDSSCQGAPDSESMQIDGEAAQALVYDRSDCTHDHHVVVVGVIHGTRGFDVMWLAKARQDDARREQFQSILDTFEFVD